MAVVAFSITKRVAFRSSTQEFSNVYHYNPGSLPNAALADDILEELEGYEKGFHSSEVTFVRGACWSAGGSPGANQMISQLDMSGTGSGTPIANWDWERAFLAYWPAGVDTRGKPVFLRKWYHSACAVGGVSVTQPILENKSGYSGASRALLAAEFNQVRVVGPGGYTLCSATGRPSAGDALAHEFLEHHQLGDQWRST